MAKLFNGYFANFKFVYFISLFIDSGNRCSSPKI